MERLFTVPTSGSTLDLDRQLVKIRGTLQRVTFRNDDNGYTIARLLPDDDRDVVTVVGTFLNPIIGDTIICFGHWTKHAQWGAQLTVVRHESVRPATAAGIEKYLGSGMVKGVGPVTAKRIVAKFGDKALDVIEQNPDELLKVPGLGSKTLAVIKSAWQGQSDVRNILVFLQSHGVSPVYAAKIFKKYGSQSIEIVERNPYQLATDIWGIGFKSADRIAEQLGFAEDDPRRLEAGVIYVLTQAVETGGNVYLTREELARECEQILGPHSIEDAIAALIIQERLIREDAVIEGALEQGFYTPALYAAEKALAIRVLSLTQKSVVAHKMQQVFDRRGGSVETVLSDEQSAAVAMALSSRVSVITGGPGVGKTTTTNALVRSFQARDQSVLLASPTGRAAKRLSEVTGCPAVTVHRLLAYDPISGAFQRNADSPLECDVLLIDESSMLDTHLTQSLLDAVPNDAQVVFVGDVDQLPSVGPGNVLRDIISSGVVPVTKLTKVFRQAALSRIISSAHAINRGRVPELPSPRDTTSDFVFIEAAEADVIAGKIVAIVVTSLAKRGYVTSEIQVLAPMQRGSAGSTRLNECLQTAINPPRDGKAELTRSGKLFRQGDRIIQLRNNYEKAVFNGDIGVVTAIDPKSQVITAEFDGREVIYEAADVDELSLAYSLSIHKSQGSEFPAVVVALHTQHYALLQRNLIYTALTRAKKFAVLVGSKKALAMAVSNDRQASRHTRLKERLCRLLP